MRLFLLSASVLAASIPPVAAQSALSPEQVGEIFCIVTLANDADAIAGLLAPALAQKLDAAWAASDAIAEAAPDEKPPLGDGVPWKNHPDLSHKCDVGAVAIAAAEAMVEIAQFYDQADGNAVIDRLILARVVPRPNTPSAWRITDLAYGSGGTLASMLDEISGALPEE